MARIRVYLTFIIIITLQWVTRWAKLSVLHDSVAWWGRGAMFLVRGIHVVDHAAALPNLVH